VPRKKKNLQSFNHEEEPQKNNITKSQKRIQQQSSTAMSRNSKLRNEQIPEVRPMLQICCGNASINALAVPHALREISQQSIARAQMLSLSLCVRFLPYTKEVCGCKSGLIKLISEILVN
jgi:hypothetical protein